MSRPLGVTLIALFLVIEGFTNGIVIYGYATQGPFTPSSTYLLADSVAGFVLAFSLWSGMRWGRYGVIILSGVEIFVSLIGGFLPISVSPSGPFEVFTNVVVNLIVIYYLMRPEVVAFFELKS